MIRAAICDNEPAMLDYLYEHISAEFGRQGAEVNIDKFTAGRDFLEAERTEPFDMVFLDIRMSDMNGFDVAAKIRGITDETYIIFITTENTLVYESFRFQPFDFIPKIIPFENPDSIDKKSFFEQHISSTIERLIPKLTLNQPICLELSRGEKAFVPPKEIRLIRSMGNYVEYDIIGRETIRQRRKLDEVGAGLSKQLFLRIHKSYIINMKFIKSIIFSKSIVIMDDDSAIAISKSQRKQAEAAYVKYLRDFGGKA